MLHAPCHVKQGPGNHPKQLDSSSLDYDTLHLKRVETVYLEHDHSDVVHNPDS